MTEIFHITHIRNLPNIIRDGGLWCDHVVSERNLAHVSIAHQHIKDRRSAKQVPCSVGGTLANYVPFYFAPRSPMLYAISRGYVQGYVDGQRPILHLVSSAEVVQQSNLPFTFTDGHAEVDISRFFVNLDDLNQIDWRIMQDPIWRDTLQDGDRKRRRQAEFLVHEFFPLNLIEAIGVVNETMAKAVSSLLEAEIRKPVLKILPAWYY